MINLKVKTLDSQTYDFTVDNETTVRQFKETIAEKTKISADLQRIIYCGRVLVDEKPLKDYDVNGKVVHVVERPPPTSRTVAGTTTTGENTARRRNGTQIRGTPLFRGLDGMVVGTMTIPMNGQAQGSIPALNPSSFCMNRITVARHMLDCVNNIISYLENPERGLNNSTLDILTQGRFTMESTVVEVGISAPSSIDLSQNQTQNFMDLFGGALSAALRQDRRNNVTVLQLPSVFNADGSATNSSTPAPTQNTEDSNNVSGASSSTMQAEATAAEPNTSILENNGNSVPSENTQDNTTSSITLNANRDNASTSRDNNSAGDERRSRSNSRQRSTSQQRTRTRALAEVVEHYRTTQTRFEPYVNQFYDLLENEPHFEEGDTTSRENSQRIFDRVSEAMHYMSHALHAMSDLMLDLTQNTPRYLSCRPILVEQSGFVSSNNYLASFMQPSGSESTGGVPSNSNNSNSNNQQSQSAVAAAAAAAAQNTSNQNNATINQTFTTPLGRSVTITAPDQANAAPNEPQVTHEIVLNMPRRVIIPNPQLQVARLIQAVVNSAPMDADLHVQIDAPNLLSVGIPIGVGAAGPFTLGASASQSRESNTSQSSAQTGNSTSSNNSNNGNNNNNNNNAGGESDNNRQEQPRVTTATHPTTSTQTRSTPRPQVHVANMPSSWSYRDIPENMFSSFDRFLPCSSHHIRETEQSSNSNESNNEANAPPSISNIVIPNIVYRPSQITTRRRRVNIPERNFPPNRTNSSNSTNESNSSSTRSTPNQSSTAPSTGNVNQPNEVRIFSNEELNIPMSLFGSNLTIRDLIETAPSPLLLNRIRNELLTCIVDNLFSGSTITEENMEEAINNFLQLLDDVLIFLPQFDLPDYDARASVENFLRNRIPHIINLIHDDSSTEFGTRFLRELIQFGQSFLRLLVTCVGRNNAELYLNQVSQMEFLSSENADDREPLRALHRHLMSAIVRQLDRAVQNNLHDIQQYLVIRRPAAENNQTNNTSTVTPMETDEVPVLETHNVEVSALSLPHPSERPTDEPLPSINNGSETWHTHFPASWLPIITRDTERQRKQSPPAPFSDAYLSGMSAKRRKLISNSKSQPEVPHLIADGVRRSIQVAGLSSHPISNNSGSLSSSNNPNSINDLAIGIGSDTVTQNSYIESLRSSIQDRLNNDTNYVPSKFPNSSKYFSK